MKSQDERMTLQAIVWNKLTIMYPLWPWGWGAGASEGPAKE